MKLEKRKVIVCEHCQYQWESRAQLKTVSCPSCLRKTKVFFIKEKKHG
jgi:rubrerythrin